MTIKEIAEKYSVSYNMVYAATYGVYGEPYRGKERNYDEQQVVRNMQAMILEKAEKYERKAMEHWEMLERIKKGGR